MKKLLFMLLFVPIFLLSSCSNSNDLAQVEISFEISGIAKSGENLYTIQGEEVSIDRIDIKSLTNENAIIQRVVFSIDGFPLPINVENPFTTSFSTQNFKVGKHQLVMTGVVLQEDKTLTNIQAVIPITVVASQDDLPEDATEIGTYTIAL